MDKSLREYFRRIGRKGGKAKTPAKLAAAKQARAAMARKRQQGRA
jgi:hypothetical protein